MVFDNEPNQPLYTYHALSSLLDIEVYEVLCFHLYNRQKRGVLYGRQNVRLGWPEWWQINPTLYVYHAFGTDN